MIFDGKIEQYKPSINVEQSEFNFYFFYFNDYSIYNDLFFY